MNLEERLEAGGNHNAQLIFSGLFARLFTKEERCPVLGS